MHYLSIKPLKFNIRLHFFILRIWVFQWFFELQSANNKWKAAAREPKTHHLAITICHKIRDPNGSQPKWYHKSILLSYHANMNVSSASFQGADSSNRHVMWYSPYLLLFGALTNLLCFPISFQIFKPTLNPQAKDETVNLCEILTIKPLQQSKQLVDVYQRNIQKWIGEVQHPSMYGKKHA